MGKVLAGIAANKQEREGPGDEGAFPFLFAFLRIQFTIEDVEGARPMVWEVCGRSVGTDIAALNSLEKMCFNT